MQLDLFAVGGGVADQPVSPAPVVPVAVVDPAATAS